MTMKCRGARYTVATALLATLLIVPPEVTAQRVLPLGPDDPNGRLILSVDRSHAHPQCPTTVSAESLFDGQDADWARINADRWDESAIVRTVREAAARSRAALPGPPIDICLGIANRPTQPTLERMGGIVGAAFPRGVVVILVAPALNADWLTELPSVVAHEYHHVATARPAGNGLDVLIREGRAHHFAFLAYPAILRAPVRALSASEISQVWPKIRDDVSGDPAQFLRTYMFGGPYFGDVVPRWAGYTVGFCLVWAYTQTNANISVSELATVPAAEFVTREISDRMNLCPSLR